jgi:hypothetical protein
MRLRRERPAPPAVEGAAARPRPVATPGQLRRERRALVRAREERIRDLGGLMLEMYRRDKFREDLIFEHCGELLSLEARLAELDAILNAAVFGARRSTSGRCLCGAPLIWGSHFCANCGRPAGDAVVACARCAHPLPADARFCVSCGAAAEAPEVPAAVDTPEEAYEEAAVEAEAQQAEAEAEAEAVGAEPDPWEK